MQFLYHKTSHHDTLFCLTAAPVCLIFFICSSLKLPQTIRLQNFKFWFVIPYHLRQRLQFPFRWWIRHIIGHSLKRLMAFYYWFFLSRPQQSAASYINLVRHKALLSRAQVHIPVQGLEFADHIICRRMRPLQKRGVLDNTASSGEVPILEIGQCRVSLHYY